MASSSDGVVTATIDTTTASVLLTVDFTVTGSSIHTTAATTVYAITVTEQTTGRVVRGLASASAPGGAVTGIDHEAPFGVGLSYIATAYGAAGGLLATSATAAVTLTSATTFATWLKSLTTPSLSLAVDTAEAPQWSRPITQNAIQVIGRPDPIVVSDVRQYETATLAVYTQTAAAEAGLLALLGTPGPYLLQLPGYGEPDRFVTVGAVTRQGVATSTDPLRVWSLPVICVARPDPTGWSVAIPGRTYADTQAALPLYSNRTGTYLSRSQ